jgi:hypothetical protein
MNNAKRTAVMVPVDQEVCNRWIEQIGVVETEYRRIARAEGRQVEKCSGNE